MAAVAVLALLSALALAVYAVVRSRARRGIATASQRATYDVLHLAGIAAEPLRNGLTASNAGRAVRPLRRLTGSAGLTIVAADGTLLAYDGAGSHHRDQALAAGIRVVGTSRATVLGARELVCDQLECEIRGAVAVPLTAPAPGGRGPVGALVALSDGPPAPGLVQATIETATWAATQLALVELESSRERLARAEVRALRAQISPHFIYNALSAIASFVRTDPEHARALILDFAEFTRYSFRAHGEFTTLAEELHSIDRYLAIERARFGGRLEVGCRSHPRYCRSPSRSCACSRWWRTRSGTGWPARPEWAASASWRWMRGRTATSPSRTTASAWIRSPWARLTGEFRRRTRAHVGLANVDDRLRSAFGDDFGLVVETALGAGTKVSMRVPKFHPGVRSSQPLTAGAAS